jgi:ABC-type branched-subunit amino acid transport system substrate-binding protein
LPRRCLLRPVAPFAFLAVAAILAGCAPARVAAPLGQPQSPYGYRPPAPPPAPAAAAVGAKVGLLVPMSGPNAELGKALLEAAQMALFDSGSDLALVPRDTAGTRDGAAAAARAVVGEGARLILGPLLVTEVEAVKPVARDARINVIAFSTATQAAGGNVFLMGFLPRQEVVREVGFARERGLSRFAALAPNSPYGRLMTDSLREIVGSSGGTVGKVELYDARGDTTAAVQRLLPGGAAAAAGGAAAAAPSFEALMLPEGGARVKQIAGQLRTAGLDPGQVRLLGSGLWDEPDMGTEPALVGGWFAAPSPEGRRDFANRFAATYGHAPPRLASLGYDAAALAAALARGQGGEPFSQEAILNPRGFAGVDGLFRFNPNGQVQRGLAVLEVAPEGNNVVSPAPQGFQDLAY